MSNEDIYKFLRKEFHMSNKDILDLDDDQLRALLKPDKKGMDDQHNLDYLTK